MSRSRKLLLLAIGIPVALVVLVSAGTFVYIHFIQADPAPRLTVDTTAEAASDGAVAPSSSSTAVVPSGSVGGTWTATSSSLVGYRVQETLFGQDTEAVGRTNAVTGTFTISGSTVSTAAFTVDLKKVKSDEDRRDSQFQGRLMETSKFPTATFKLTSPITLSAVPTDSTIVEASATGDLTLHGVTKSVTFTVKAKRDGANVNVNGSIPITFSDYDIENPSNQAASVGSGGELEFTLVLSR
jgi:polyisoprenoid-binding protein YceI